MRGQTPLDRLVGQEQQRRRQSLLQHLLIGINALLYGACFLALMHWWRNGIAYRGVTWYLPLAGLIVAASLTWLSYRRPRLIAAVICSAAVSLTTVLLIKLGVLLPHGELLACAAIMLTGLLLGRRQALGVTIFLNAVLVICASKQSLQDPDQVSDIGFFCLTLLLVCLVMWLICREYERILERAVIGEVALTYERQGYQPLVRLGQNAAETYHDLANPLTALALCLPDIFDQPQQTAEEALAATLRMQEVLHKARKRLAQPTVSSPQPVSDQPATA